MESSSSIDVVDAVGLHNPLLHHGGFPVVDGVVTAPNCPHAHRRASAWTPARSNERASGRAGG